MYLADTQPGQRYAPLDHVTVCAPNAATITVRDGDGRIYQKITGADPMEFVIGGAPGTHTVVAEDASDDEAEVLRFRVRARTRIDDETGRYHRLLEMLHHSMINLEAETQSVYFDGRTYRYFICWLRDHVHVLKGMKYFSAAIEDAIELYASTQRPSGMIWDNVYPRSASPNAWDLRFSKGGFIEPFEDGSAEFKRIPVEADVEYLFVEGIYHTWKALADDHWMAQLLDSGIAALDYSLTSAYRWSEKFQLIKRGYTIDTWDYQPRGFGTRSGLMPDDPMVIDPATTQFGVMYGDNTGYAASCRYLAEMLEHADRAKDASRFRRRADDITARLNAIAWTGRHYRHHVPEQPGGPSEIFKIDEDNTLSLSNAYSLNRGIAHDKCVAIIDSYRELAGSLPPGSPGEWYGIYPPIPAGFETHHEQWQYMNGGVTPIVAGELAHGAFEHGFETYGAGILDRVGDLAQRDGGQLHAVYTGAFPDPGRRGFAPLDLSNSANIDLVGRDGTESGVPGWSGHGANDLSQFPVGEQVLAGVPFLVVDPARNDRRAALGLSTRPRYAEHIVIPIGSPAASVYLLHAVAGTGPSGVAGSITFQYGDGTTATRYILSGRDVASLWMPEAPPTGQHRPMTALAWRGANSVCPNIGLLAHGIDNPYPERQIESIRLVAAADGGFWGVLGVTTSDARATFPPDWISGGIPDSWAAAAVVYALVEGLAGVVDRGQGYNQATLAPRWQAAGCDRAEATISYPASDRYLAYRYLHQPEVGRIVLEVTGSGDTCSCHILLPDNAVKADWVDSSRDGALEVTTTRIEGSAYADFELRSLAPATLTIGYQH